MARPTQFDRDKVLEKAMNAFWDQGYCAMGVAELGSITRLKPGSLYGAFESKQGLFMATLDRYGQASVEHFKNTLLSAPSPLKAIRSLFHKLAEDSAGPQAMRSCFLVNTALEIARHDESIQSLINGYFLKIEGILRETLERAQEKGEISPDKDAEALAAFLLSNIWGLRVLGATGPSHRQAEMIVTQLLTVLDPRNRA